MVKSVFVTGATNGTGYAIAKRFAKEGYAVFIGSRNGSNANSAAQKLAEEYNVFTKGYETKIVNTACRKACGYFCKNTNFLAL